MDTEQERREVEPNPEPAREPFDAHQMPLDDEDDARFLREDDPRRVALEHHRRSLRERIHDRHDEPTDYNREGD